MTAHELIGLLAAMPPDSPVVIGSSKSWSFLQRSQVKEVSVLYGRNAVMLGDAEVELRPEEPQAECVSR
jgi:hypothetical protein